MRMVKMQKEHRAVLTAKLQAYVREELDCDIGNLEAENLLDFVIKQAGPIIYNQAIADARTVLLQQVERSEEELYSLEQPLELFKRS